MSNSLKDILASRSSSEPPEIRTIKQFVKDRLKGDVRVTVSKSQIAIWAPNAALAGNLRMQVFELKKSLRTKKKLIIRIGQNPI